METASVWQKGKKLKSGNESKFAIVAAIIGNVLIAVTKLIAAWFTGSSAMISEGVHSLVDTGNGILIYYGVVRSKAPADDLHPFGHGRELYFWSLIVAISIFAIGGGISVYEGIRRLIHPEPLDNVTWNYVVLGIAFVLESISFFFAWRTFKRASSGEGVWRTIRTSKDPSTFTVLFEDSAALIGLVVAFAGVLLEQLLGSSLSDGIASIVIGTVLGAVAVLLGYETKSLLIGEALEKEKMDEIRKIIHREESVEKILHVMSIYVGPDSVVLTLELRFKKDTSGEELRRVLRRIHDNVKKQFPEISRVFYETSSVGL